jgi:hypothetical protein
MPNGESVLSGESPLGSGSLATNPAPDAASSIPETGETQATPEGGTNWDDPSNPYLTQAREFENRFKGLQGTVQRYAEELKSVREAQAQAQEQQFYAQIQHLDPVQRQKEIQQFQNYRHVEAERQRLSEESSALENMSKVVFPLYLSQQYGIPPQELAKYDSPQEMEIRAKAWKEYNDQLKVQQRQVQGSDNFGPTERSAAIPRQKSSDWNQASQNFAQELARRLR